MIVLPFVHDNGTSAAELLALRETAYAALDAAAVAMKRLGPNARDYRDALHMDAAVGQHMRRMKVVRDLMDELEIECKGIEEQRR